MSKHIEDCQTSEELAQAIGDFLKHGGIYIHIVDETTHPITQKTECDHRSNRMVWGCALSQYNKIRKSYPKLPLAQIDASDPISGLAQLQGLCLDWQRGEGEEGMLNGLENPVPCVQVSAITRVRSDNIARTLKAHQYPVVIAGRKNYCNAEHAAVLWPKWKKHWQKKKESEEI